ncbi:MAG TPA: hypothetical protein VD996_13645 [Chitinophagaceae bacterium]|nr:hypothetical protein [Chitinophagaceae bacterium]
MKHVFDKQFELPTGTLGRRAAWLMLVSNQEKNQWLIEKPDIHPSNHVLEIGYAPVK